MHNATVGSTATPRRGAARRGGDTRSAIQAAALRRFTDQGYDQTSLREIAEDLGVTKAALYYHFRTKEDLMDSIVRDMGESLDALVGWVAQQPPTREARLECLRRLAEVVNGGLADTMRCVQQNEVAFASLPRMIALVHGYKQALWRACTPPDATVEDRLRARLAVFALFSSAHAADDLGGTTDERRAVALRVALDIIP